jgi:hypothetical protein
MKARRQTQKHHAVRKANVERVALGKRKDGKGSDRVIASRKRAAVSKVI